jgi:hypothetical protein
MGFAFGSVLRTPSGPPGGSRSKILSETRIKQILGLEFKKGKLSEFYLPL